METILHLENRIEQLTKKNELINMNIINKLKRKLRKLKENTSE